MRESLQRRHRRLDHARVCCASNIFGEGTHSLLVASRRCLTCQRRLALFADLLCRRHVPFAGAAER